MRAMSAKSPASPAPPSAPLKIESLGLLVRRVREGLAARVEQALADDGIAITHLQFQVIAWLGRLGLCSASRLAQGLGHDAGALTRVIEKLVQRGWVQREAQADDRRIVNLRLTDAGSAVWAQGYAHYVRINACAVRGLSAAERQQLIDLLARVADALETAP